MKHVIVSKSPISLTGNQPISFFVVLTRYIDFLCSNQCISTYPGRSISFLGSINFRNFYGYDLILPTFTCTQVAGFSKDYNVLVLERFNKLHIKYACTFNLARCHLI